LPASLVPSTTTAAAARAPESIAAAAATQLLKLTRDDLQAALCNATKHACNLLKEERR
jgi:hypothetical protein